MLEYVHDAAPTEHLTQRHEGLEKAEKRLVKALADTCNPGDDFLCVVTDDQDSQCKKLLQRLAPAAKYFIEREGLVEKEGGSSSIGANGPPGSKD
jgi:hypothetical protein